MITKQKKSEHLVFVLYDSLANSVFESQVLQPLLLKLQNTNLKISLISFEKNRPSIKIIKKITAHECIDLIIVKKYLFFGLLTLKPAIKKLHAILNNLPPYELLARGPHAGWVSLHATKNTSCTSITIQARGILPEEYAFVHNQEKFPLAWIHALRKKHFETLEKRTYCFENPDIPLTFQAVSPALKNYLITRYGATPKAITIAQDDIPKPIDSQLLFQWRTATRKKLGIPKNSHVYCYNGSAKSWQCPEKVVAFFVQQLKTQPHSFLLIVTQDKKAFQSLLQLQKLDPSHYYICTTEHSKVFQYLAASDTGLLFREKNIINWVSRPTKALEYQAANLKIVHNNTIEILSQSTQINH